MNIDVECFFSILFIAAKNEETLSDAQDFSRDLNTGLLASPEILSFSNFLSLEIAAL